MFTGIIESIGTITAIVPLERGARLDVSSDLATGDLEAIRLGDSIAVMGACLTVVVHEKGRFSFDLSQETLDRTSLGDLKLGQRVNLERAMILGARLDGHIVQGHVDAKAKLTAKRRDGQGWVLSYAVPENLLPQVVEKGSITFDGVSLTVAKLHGPHVDVAIIPHTYSHTTLGDTPIGGYVNVETDILGKYVERMLKHLKGETAESAITENLLAKHGFL